MWFGASKGKDFQTDEFVSHILLSLLLSIFKGVLKTNILSAKGLKAMDHKLFKKDSSDPFVKAKGTLYICE